MTTVNAHFDGKMIVPEGPVDLPIGKPLRVHVEAVDDDGASEAVQAGASQHKSVTPAPRRFQPLDIQIDPELSHAIALDPEFNIEESY
jgi:hypothetical protein